MTELTEVTKSQDHHNLQVLSKSENDRRLNMTISSQQNIIRKDNPSYNLPNKETVDIPITINNKVDSPFTLFFEGEEEKAETSTKNELLDHMAFNIIKIFWLILEIPIRLFLFIWGVICLIFSLLKLIIMTLFQILLCIILIIYFLLTFFFIPGKKNFSLVKYFKNLKIIKWKNTHPLYLFLKLEVPIKDEEQGKTSKSELLTKWSSKKVIKVLPIRNISRVIKEVR